MLFISSVVLLARICLCSYKYSMFPYKTSIQNKSLYQIMHQIMSKSFMICYNSKICNCSYVRKTWKVLSMSVKLFILGLPGSGKSAIARSIVDYLNRQQSKGWSNQQWSATRFNDYAILLDMFRQDTEGKRFKPAYPSGFDVLDLEVFDEALRAFEQKLDTYISSLKSNEKKLVIAEFSRNDYSHAFQQFSSVFLQDAYFIHLEADMKICKQRIYERWSDLSYPE